MLIFRRRLRFRLFLIVFFAIIGTQSWADPIAWDATSKQYDAKRGETNTQLFFNLTNISSQEIVIKSARPSCGCTVAKFPETPWKLAPRAHGRMEVQVDLRWRQGLLSKTIAIESSVVTQLLSIKIQMPELDLREKNRLVAFADRQAVFKADCGRCHLQPAVGKQGEELFRTICSICHEAKDRAEMVPDLAQLKHPADAVFWDDWVRRGKPGTFMPAFSKPFGGPLDEQQIVSLVTYLSQRSPPAPPGSAAADTRKSSAQAAGAAAAQ